MGDYEQIWLSESAPISLDTYRAIPAKSLYFLDSERAFTSDNGQYVNFTDCEFITSLGDRSVRNRPPVAYCHAGQRHQPADLLVSRAARRSALSVVSSGRDTSRGHSPTGLTRRSPAGIIHRPSPRPTADHRAWRPRRRSVSSSSKG